MPPVLFISSYHPGFPTFFQQVEGVRSVLEPAGAQVDVEFMDTKRFYSQETFEHFRLGLARKLSQLPPYGVVITADDNAFTFARQEQDGLFKGIPIVFCGVNNESDALAQNTNPGMTGVIESISAKDTLQLIDRLFPHRTTVHIIKDGTVTGQTDYKRVMQAAEDVKGIKVRTLDLSEMSYDQFGARLEELGPQDTLLLLSAYKDKNGAGKTFDQILRLIKTRTGAPLFHLWEHGMGQGMLGGKIISHFVQGQMAAQMALRILSGEDISTMPVVPGDQANRYIFDGRELMRFGIEDDELPENADIRYRDPSFWKENQTLISLTVLFLLAQTAIITLLVLSRRRLKLRETQLRESLQIFSSLFEDNASIMLLVSPKDGTVVKANSAAEKFYGHDFNTTPHSICDITVEAEENVGRRMGSVGQRALKQFQTRHRLADGTVRNVEVYSGPVILEGRNLLYSIIHDISERVKAEEELVRAMEDARTANRAKSEFLANISHEIRTPLNGVMGMLQLSLGTEQTDEQHEYSTIALESSRNLLRVLNDVLDLTKMEAHKMDLRIHLFSPVQLFEQTAALFRVQAADKNIHLETRMPEDLPELYGDEGRIRQILFNLVGNAVKFTEEGTVGMEMCLQHFGRGDHARLLFSITDTGIGIPDNKLDYIFEAFTQLDGSFVRKHQGTGLGLPIVKRLVTLMDGNMSISSTPGEGAEIHFSIPVQIRRSEHDTDTRQAPVPRPEKKRILVAEDDSVNALLVRRMLEKRGHDVHCVHNGKEALDALSSSPFDAIFMDIQMPEMDGLQATRIIRNAPTFMKYAHITIVALTAHAMPGDRQRFLAEGMDTCMFKPLNEEDLDSVLASLK